MTGKRNKMTWLTLESIQRWGAPVEIDGTPLNLTQGRVLMGTIETAMDSGHQKEAAVSMGVQAFRRMYEKSTDGTEWRALRKIPQHGGVEVRNKYFKQDQKERIMAKVKRSVAERNRRLEAVRTLLDEAGRRNSGADKARIVSALDGLFGALTRGDQESVLKALGKKVGKRIRFKGATP